MLGAVGAYGWNGTVVHRTVQKFQIFPKNAFENVLEDRNHSSLLGEFALIFSYSVFFSICYCHV